MARYKKIINILTQRRAMIVKILTKGLLQSAEICSNINELGKQALRLIICGKIKEWLEM